MLHPFFQQNPYRAESASDLENDALLALHLVLYFLTTQNSDDGTWPGGHVGATLRNTCHALEALHMFGWGASANAIESGIAWLVNLPGILTLQSEEEESNRLYPSRFKTLALLGEFSDFQLRRDFDELEEYLSADGLLRGIMANQLLATMVYVDCLNHLEEVEPLPVLSQERRELAVNYILKHVQLWQADRQQRSQDSHINNLGDLSYAANLLFRAQKLSKQSELSQAVLAAMMSMLAHPETMQPVPTDALYCGIQLATHFPEVVQAREAVRALIDFVRTKYEKNDLNRETSFFHPLVLRLMFGYHRDQLKVEMTQLMLDHERQNLALRQQNAEQDLKDDFRDLIKNRFEVEISEVQPLTGGFTRAEVFRVHFAFNFLAVGEFGDFRTTTYQPSPGSLVIKRGNLDSLHKSIEQYRNLPDALKPYFARHVEYPQVLKAEIMAPSYLIMEDLTYMNTFQHLIARIDQGRLSTTQRKDLEKACATICSSLFVIYDQTKQADTDFFGSQLSRLYLGEIEKNLIRMCRPDKFPNLKAWLRGFWLGERKYVSIEHYLRKIENHQAKLCIPYLMLTHGDCHSRNIMLDAQLQQMKLIDLDHLDRDGDYIKDFALLIEDMCVFRFLFDEGYRLYLGNGSGRFGLNATKPKLDDNQIEYSPFSSEAVRLFQQHLLQHLATYAQAMGDTSWKERLWLALATYLIFLVAKQKEREYAIVVYVEAVKLLDELAVHMDRGIPLGEIPFPGKHPAGVAPEIAKNGLTSPSWYRENPVLAELHDGTLALASTIKYKLNSSGRVAQYYSPNSLQPFAVIDGKKQPPTILLACPSESLTDPQGIVQERETSSALQTILRVAGPQGASPILDLIQQALELNG